jgi:hypothetical protein
VGLAGNDKRAVFLPPSLRDYITCPKASVIEITIGLRDVMQAVDEARRDRAATRPHRRHAAQSQGHPAGSGGVNMADNIQKLRTSGQAYVPKRLA